MKILFDYLQQLKQEGDEQGKLKKAMLEKLYYQYIAPWNILKKVRWSDEAKIAGDLQKLADFLQKRTTLDGFSLKSNLLKSEPSLQEILSKKGTYSSPESIITNVFKRYQYYIEVVLIADAIEKETNKGRAQQVLAGIGTFLTLLISIGSIYKLAKEIWPVLF